MIVPVVEFLSHIACPIALMIVCCMLVVSRQSLSRALRDLREAKDKASRWTRMYRVTSDMLEEQRSKYDALYKEKRCGILYFD